MANWWTYGFVGKFGQYPDREGNYPQPDLNISAPIGTLFTAPSSGTITGIDNSSSFGDVVTVRFDNPLNSAATHYAFLHLSSIVGGLKVGQHVSIGTPLGYGGGGNSKSGALPGFALTASDVYGFGSGWANNVKGSWINPQLDPTNFLNNIKQNGINSTFSGSTPTNTGNGNSGDSTTNSTTPTDWISSLFSALGLPTTQDLQSFFQRFFLISVGGMILLIGILALFFNSDAGKKVTKTGVEAAEIA